MNGMNWHTEIGTPAYATHGGYGYYDRGPGFGGFLGTLLFLGLLFLGARALFRGGYLAGMGRGGSGDWGRGRRGRGGPGPFGVGGRGDALEIARERLAKSEITPEQYETIRKGLEGARERREYDEGSGYGNFPFGGWMNRDRALETARERFARGEIGPEEFEMIRRALES